MTIGLRPLTDAEFLSEYKVTYTNRDSILLVHGDHLMDGHVVREWTFRETDPTLQDHVNEARTHSEECDD